ncbi:hypothetical protein ACSPAH_17160 [Buttiauxella agrestis]
MSAGSPTFTLRRIAALSLVSLWLAGCTSNDSQAPISSVGGNSNASSSSSGGMLVTQPPKMSTQSQTPQIQPVQQQPTIQPMQTQPVVSTPVQTQNGHIVYNRKYGDIPKGSYTGGSTYTVKRGDTLFYIAWITGTISVI